MQKAGARKSLFKADYDGPRDETLGLPGRGQAAPDEKAALALERRIQRAMLTLGTLSAEGPSAVRSGWPDYLIELEDRVAREKDGEKPRKRFQPTPGDISDLLPALALLDGLRPEIYVLVRHKAVDDFHYDKGACWAELGRRFGRSDTWAAETYRRALLQAGKRAGIVFSAPESHAIVAVTVMLDGVLFTHLSTSPDPRQALYDKKAGTPSEIVDCFAVWTNDKATAKAVVDRVKAYNKTRLHRGSWYRLDPFDAEASIMEQAEALKASARMQYLAGEPLEAVVRQVVEDPREAVVEADDDGAAR